MNTLRRWIVALSLCWLAGCGSGRPNIESPENVPPSPNSAQVSLTGLLTKSRADLAKEHAEWADQLRVRGQAHREGSLAFALLPQLRLPLALPIWAEAHYSTQA